MEVFSARGIFSFVINVFLFAKRVEFALLSSAVVTHHAKYAWAMNRSCSPCSILQIPFYALISDEHVFEISLCEIVTWVDKRSSRTQTFDVWHSVV